MCEFIALAALRGKVEALATKRGEVASFKKGVIFNLLLFSNLAILESQQRWLTIAPTLRRHIRCCCEWQPYIPYGVGLLFYLLWRRAKA